jgi:hypothetical protein
MEKPRRIFGIDFSGAQDAGKKIWITSGLPTGDGLVVEDCLRARDLPYSGKQLKACLPALLELVRSNQNAVFGFDFPFGLARSLIKEKTWAEWLLKFPSRFKNSDDFKKKCVSAAGNQELRRQTDNESHTPFSPYNLRLFRQTYYGISGILLPLVKDERACILPFHTPADDKPVILEICPASTLKAHGLYEKYKFRSKEDRPETRSKILEEIERLYPLKFSDPNTRQSIIADRYGDALDSLLAAMAAFNAEKNEYALTPDDNGYWKIEGYVYCLRLIKGQLRYLKGC